MVSIHLQITSLLTCCGIWMGSVLLPNSQHLAQLLLHEWQSQGLPSLTFSITMLMMLTKYCSVGNTTWTEVILDSTLTPVLLEVNIVKIS